MKNTEKRTSLVYDMVTNGNLHYDDRLYTLIDHDGQPTKAVSYWLETKDVDPCLAKLEELDIGLVMDFTVNSNTWCGRQRMYVDKSLSTSVNVKTTDDGDFSFVVASTDFDHTLFAFASAFVRTPPPHVKELSLDRLSWDSYCKEFVTTRMYTDAIVSKHDRKNDSVIYPGMDLAKVRGFFVEDFDLDNGRIMLLSGPPGTGKTSLLKDILFHAKNEDIHVIVSDPQTFLNGGADKLMKFLNDYDKAIIIIEDAEALLNARKNSKDPGFMSALLNLTDGLFSMSTNVRFLFTFNMDEIEVDSALQRPGRCYHHGRFKNYSWTEASAVAKVYDRKFVGRVDKHEYSLAEILAK